MVVELAWLSCQNWPEWSSRSWHLLNLFHVPFLDVLARPIFGRTGTRRVLAWAKPILCTAPSAVLELARVVFSELAFFQVLPRPVPGRTGTTDLWSYWHREAIRCIDGVVPSILCTALSAVMELARVVFSELALSFFFFSTRLLLSRTGTIVL